MEGDDGVEICMGIMMKLGSLFSRIWLPGMNLHLFFSFRGSR